MSSIAGVEPVPLVAACWKAVPLRVELDPVSGELAEDPASVAVSSADEAALEWALRSAECLRGRVRLVALGSATAHDLLRAGAAVGASELIHVLADPSLPSDSVAALLAPHLADADLVWCGDMSLDRGSGSVPAFLADELAAAQALGLVEVDLSRLGRDRLVSAMRRLDHGRLERLELAGKAVLSCEGGTAALRRASLPSLLASTEAPVECVSPVAPVPSYEAVSVAPFRPRARVVPPPLSPSSRERIAALLDSGGRRSRELIVADPASAASRIAAALREWGELS